MKSYLLSLNAYDFTKNNKEWITQPIDLYANRFYTNFSNKRYRTGLNVLGDYKFVGTEKTGDIFIYIDNELNASPTYLYLNDSTDASPTFLTFTDPNFSIYDVATPTVTNSVYMTNYGEVVYEPATPDLLRFVDTSSRIDIRSFKGAFTNNFGGIEQVNFSLNVYESDSAERTMAFVYDYHFHVNRFNTFGTRFKTLCKV